MRFAEVKEVEEEEGTEEIGEEKNHEEDPTPNVYHLNLAKRYILFTIKDIEELENIVDVCRDRPATCTASQKQVCTTLNNCDIDLSNILIIYAYLALWQETALECEKNG